MLSNESDSNPCVPAVVTCVEAGHLESQVLRMVDSLRRWGGRMRDVPVLAVRPRAGLPLRPSTRNAFSDLGIDFLDVRHPSRFGWYKFLNKPIAVKAATEHFKCNAVCWLDADILITREPSELFLGPDEDFAASCPDTGGLASTGPEDPNDSYWSKICSVFNLDVTGLPWVVPHRGPGLPVRLYFNGGVFVFRRECGFAEAYLKGVEDCLEAMFSHPVHRCYFHEQAALGLTVLASNLCWRELSVRSNFAFKMMFDIHACETASADILHYHSGLNSQNFCNFVKVLQDAHPDVAKWLVELGPIQNPGAARGFSTWLFGLQSKIRQELYLRRCSVMDSKKGICQH